MEICQSVSTSSTFTCHTVSAVYSGTAKCSWFLEIRVKLSINAPTPPPVLFSLSLAPVSPGSPYTLITLGMTEIPARQAATHPTGDLSVILG